MESDQLYPRISATGPTLKRDMLWHDLLDFGEMGATPIELAARLIEEGKATGTVESCAMRLMPLLNELVYMVGKRRTEHEGERFKALRMGGRRGADGGQGPEEASPRNPVPAQPVRL
jgi:hypothetical protein